MQWINKGLMFWKWGQNLTTNYCSGAGPPHRDQRSPVDVSENVSERQNIQYVPS
jgi:hypothetical protein